MEAAKRAKSAAQPAAQVHACAEWLSGGTQPVYQLHDELVPALSEAAKPLKSSGAARSTGASLCRMIYSVDVITM